MRGFNSLCTNVEPISIILPSGASFPGTALITTPLDVANSISKGLAARVVVAEVDGNAWDLFRPLEVCNLGSILVMNRCVNYI